MNASSSATTAQYTQRDRSSIVRKAVVLTCKCQAYFVPKVRNRDAFGQHRRHLPVVPGRRARVSRRRWKSFKAAPNNVCVQF